MYLLLLLVGSIGFLAMTLLGFMHGSGTHAHHGALGHGHAGAHAPSLGGHHHVGGIDSHHGVHGPNGTHTPAHTSHSQPSRGGSSEDSGRSFPVWMMISPLDIFSFSLGAGAAGILGQSLVSAALLPWLAVLGALVFNLGIVRPVMGFAMKFVSKPSDGLESVVAHTAEAITRFDESGRGLVRLTLDEQNIQLLATLETAELHHGVIVNKGDEVVVVEVDSARNTCRVSKEL